MNDDENLRVVCRYSAPNSSEMLCVHMYQYTGAGDTDADVLTAMETFFTDDWGADWQASAADDFSFDEIELDVLKDNGEVKRNIGSAAIGLVGLRVGDMCPSGVAALLTADTDLPKQRGRKYVPCLADIDVVDGLITAARIVTLALLTAEYLDVVQGILAGELTPGILSRTLGDFKPFVASGAVADVPAYQRRRKPNVGS